MSGLGALIILVVVGTTIWVGVDASKREWKGGGTVGWVLGCILLWIVAFPWYLAVRNKTPFKGEEEAYAAAGMSALAATPGAPPGVDPLYRECPHCKEPMRRDASVCPHCQRESIPWRLHEGRWWYRESDEDAWVWLDERTGEWQEHVAAPVSPSTATPE